MEIHDRLRQARIDAGYDTVIDAARALGIPYETYYMHEVGRRGITIKRARQYARAFRRDFNWLVTGQEPPPKIRADYPDPEELLADALQFVKDRLSSGQRRRGSD